MDLKIFTQTIGKISPNKGKPWSAVSNQSWTVECRNSILWHKQLKSEVQERPTVIQIEWWSSSPASSVFFFFFFISFSAFQQSQSFIISSSSLNNTSEKYSLVSSFRLLNSHGNKSQLGFGPSNAMGILVSSPARKKFASSTRSLLTQMEQWAMIFQYLSTLSSTWIYIINV